MLRLHPRLHHPDRVLAVLLLAPLLAPHEPLQQNLRAHVQPPLLMSSEFRSRWPSKSHPCHPQRIMQPDAFLTFLPSHDLEATDAFYRGVLGLELTRDQGKCRIYRVRGGAYVGFCLGSPVIPAEHRVFITIVVRDVQAAFEELTARGARPEGPVEYLPAFAVTRFLVRDPHGYLVELQRFDEPIQKPHSN